MVTQVSCFQHDFILLYFFYIKLSYMYKIKIIIPKIYQSKSYFLYTYYCDIKDRICNVISMIFIYRLKEIIYVFK